jgi:formylglycine-generating enzyme required for sulfatase activity/cation transport regulator ChaB
MAARETKNSQYPDRYAAGVLLWLKYHPRVLDAWVADHLPEVRESFLNKDTAKDRAIHIPIQIQLDGKLIDQLTPALLRPVLSRSPATLLITGEGGIGKTSFACQIARWGLGLGEDGTVNDQTLAKHNLLPVLVEQELDDTPLRTAIREQLPRNPDGTFIADELLEALLRQRRVLVILDHVSEMGDGTYAQMKQALETIPINALIITSRLKEKNLGRTSYHLLQPQKIEGAKLSRFIEPYLEAQGKKDLFEDDTEFYRTCTRLSSMMASTLQRATALLVRLYVDQVIEAGGLKTAQLPDNIPDLMLRYLCWLNREDLIDTDIRRDNDELQRDAKAVAWECLKQTYRPTDAGYADILAALKDAVDESAPLDAKARLTYLKKPLGLVQLSPAETTVKIVLDPVAEYLAALCVADYCQRDEAGDRWQMFFETLEADPEQLAAMRGFLLAVRNCAEQERIRLPQGVLPCLNEWAQLNSEELEQARRRQRINKLIDDLYDSDDKYLEQAIHNLRDEGHYAYRAIPDLLKVLNSPLREPGLRTKAVTALVHIQADQSALGQLLQAVVGNRENPSEVRVAALKGLLQVGEGRDDLVPLLQHYFSDQHEVGVLRVQAGEGLRQLGVLSQLLVVQVVDRETHHIQLVDPPKTHRVKLADAIDLTLVHIPGGKFPMGSPEGEGYSSEYPQHEVTLDGFWLGQYPVTQAQYEAVVGRNPATFRLGSNHPVETVSWHDAVAFCQRLSELTELEFHLPSEAEWEYACRAGTQTPFHTGPTITTDLANYRGTDWDYGGQIFSGSYGAGPKGIYREQTTPVGQFPPNAFGLYDMHGNVWEWCADHYHDSYEDAPVNNVPWLSSDERSNRLLRGGAWYGPPQYCRSTYRDLISPDNRFNYIGFRVVGSAARALS